MDSSLRLFVHSLKNVIFSNNPFLICFTQFKRVAEVYFELPQKSQNISKSIYENKAKLDKAKSLIDKSSKKNKFSSINLIR